MWFNYYEKIYEVLYLLTKCTKISYRIMGFLKIAIHLIHFWEHFSILKSFLHGFQFLFDVVKFNHSIVKEVPRTFVLFKLAFIKECLIFVNFYLFPNFAKIFDRFFSPLSTSNLTCTPLELFVSPLTLSVNLPVPPPVFPLEVPAAHLFDSHLFSLLGPLSLKPWLCILQTHFLKKEHKIRLLCWLIPGLRWGYWSIFPWLLMQHSSPFTIFST